MMSNRFRVFLLIIFLFDLTVGDVVFEYDPEYGPESDLDDNENESQPEPKPVAQKPPDIFPKSSVAEEEVEVDPMKISHNLKMPLLGFGTAALGGSGKEAICHALHSGFRLFDSAQAKEWYQEKDMGAAIKDCWKNRNLDELLIVTKVHPRSYQYDRMYADLKQSQQLFYGKNRTLDAVLLHAPYCWWAECTPQDKQNKWQDAWKNLEKFVSMGMIEAIGVSNFNVPQMEELVRLTNKRVALVQNWMDPFHQDRDVRQFCKDHKIAYMAYSSLGTQWHWKGEDNPVFSSSVLKTIAQKHNKSITLVVLSWVIQEGLVAVPRTTNLDHITENAGLMGISGSPTVFLDEDDMTAIRALDGTNN